MNDFFHHVMQHPLTVIEQHSTLTPKERSELVSLFENAQLPSTAMSAEAADGYITGLALGPETLMPYEWLAQIFGQQTLPVCADEGSQNRLLALLQRRHNDVVDAMSRPDEYTNEDNQLAPLMAAVKKEEVIAPYRLDDKGLRQGNWFGKAWAQGFYQATSVNGTWQALQADQQHCAMLQPMVLLLKGYNPENPDQQIDDDATVLAALIDGLRDIYDFGRLQQRKEAPLQVQSQPSKDIFKIGAAEPCLCGSGKKYKKCCGTPEAVAALN